jgi:hypothetical protein
MAASPIKFAPVASAPEIAGRGRALAGHALVIAGIPWRSLLEIFLPDRIKCR